MTPDTRRLGATAAALLLPLLFVLQSCGGETKNTPAAKADPLAIGQTVFQSRCVFCHGQYGEGAPAASAYPNANLADGVWVHGGTHEQLVQTIDSGVPGTPMQPWGGTLSKEELDDVARYVATLAPTGNRRVSSRHAGCGAMHVAIDEHSRGHLPAILPDETATSTSSSSSSIARSTPSTWSRSSRSRSG